MSFAKLGRGCKYVKVQQLDGGSGLAGADAVSSLCFRDRMPANSMGLVDTWAHFDNRERCVSSSFLCHSAFLPLDHVIASGDAREAQHNKGPIRSTQECNNLISRESC
jgi:hypothetical protein